MGRANTHATDPMPTTGAGDAGTTTRSSGHHGHPEMERSCEHSSGFPRSMAKRNIRLNKLPFDTPHKRPHGITESYNIYRRSDE